MDAARELLVGLAFGPIGIVGLVAAALVAGVVIGVAIASAGYATEREER